MAMASQGREVKGGLEVGLEGVSAVGDTTEEPLQ